MCMNNQIQHLHVILYLVKFYQWWIQKNILYTFVVYIMVVILYTENKKEKVNPTNMLFLSYAHKFLILDT